MRRFCISLLIFMVLNYCSAVDDGFVKEVSCSAESFTVVISPTDPEVMKWMADPKAQPVVYVSGHKSRHECGTSMKNDKGSLNYNLTIPYGQECDVRLIDLQPNHRTAETTIVLEDNANQTYAKTLRINHVFCLYAKSVQTIRFSDVSNGHEVVASTGGKPKPKVEMLFRGIEGKPLTYAKIDDTVEFFVALNPDSAYHGITPKECVFSDREDINSPEARKTTFVQNGCPVVGMNELIDPLANVNDQVYFSKFKVFRFAGQTTVFAHCIVQVCLKREECSKPCYKKVLNSTLTADRLRFRHKRSAEAKMLNSSSTGTTDVDLTQKFFIVEKLPKEVEHESPTAAPQVVVEPKAKCEAAATSIGFMPIIITCIFATLFVISTLIAIYFGCKLKRTKAKQDRLDVMSTYSNAAFNLPIAYSYQRSSTIGCAYDQQLYR